MINKQDIEKARLFLQSLEGEKIRADETALLVVDVQRFFCDPGMGFVHASKKSAEAAEKIQSIVPAFRKAGVAVYPIRTVLTDRHADFKSQGGEGFYMFESADDEKTRWKTKASAFEDTTLYGTLVNEGRKNLILCGVYLDMCVRATAMDAAHYGALRVKPAFNVAVLPDLSACSKTSNLEEKRCAEKMERMRVASLSAEAVLKALQA